MTSAMDGFDAAGSDQLLNHRVEQFNLKALVDCYDADAHDGSDAGSLEHDAPAARQAVSAAYDSEALGGELAQAYAANGCLAGVALSAAQGVVAATGFGENRQPVAATLDPNSIKLS